MNVQVTQYINTAPEEQKEIMNAIRSLIHHNIKNVTEEFKWSRPVFKMKKDFAYLQINKNHVNLGFYKDIDKLDDPDKLLEGTGKTMRHIKLRKASDINTKLLSEWFLVLSNE